MPPPSNKERLLHPSLHRIPKKIRYLAHGILNKILFFGIYHTAVLSFHPRYDLASIFAVVSFGYTPIGHIVTLLITFGWPPNYWKSFLANYSVNLVNVGMGSACAGVLEWMDFNYRVEAVVQTITGGWHLRYLDTKQGGIYSSIAITILTGIFMYVASNYVNSQSRAAGDISKDKPVAANETKKDK